MIRDIESLRVAQQMLSTNAINQLNASINNFQLLKLIDGRETRVRPALAEQLITIEDRLLIVKNQIQTIRNFYKEM